MRALLSASNLAAAALCPAKPRLEAPFSEQESEYSTRGTRLHRYFRTDLDRSALSVDDRDLLWRADGLAKNVISEFIETHELSDAFVDEHEVELHGVVPGHADNILSWEGGRYVCILDLKSGVRPADEAPDNYQLACYALLQYCRYTFAHCVVAIVQPDAFGKRVTTASYSGADMLGVAQEIRDIYDATLEPDAKPVAGEKQCHYCRAKEVCPAYREKFMQIEILGMNAVSSLEDDDLLRVYRAIQFANKIKESVTDELRIRIESGAIPGKLRSTGSTRTLVDPDGLWGHLVDRYGDRDGFAGMYEECRKLSFGEFESLIQRLEGCTQKQAKDIAKEITAPFVSDEPKKPTPIPEI